ncbi:MAG: PKD domain-containing protein [Bacteroidales bacterium]|nr:PKD domain-containing protein [Bacteroidales bacterium]
MKRSLLLANLFLLLSISLFSQKSWVSYTSDSPALPQVVIEDQNDSRVVMGISISGMFVTNVEQEGQTFQRIELLEEKTTKDVGRPELPMLNAVIGVPGSKLARVNILEMETMVLDNYLIFPFQKPTTDNPGGNPGDFSIDQDFYNSQKPYPGNQIYLDRPGIWRDVKITGLHVIPFDYNPSTKKLEVITSIKLEIEFYGVDAELSLNKSKEVSPTFYKMYETSILNFASMGYSMKYKSSDDIKYLIITNTNALDAIQPLVDWKNQQGFRVEVRTMETGFTTPQNFKDYIEQLYDNDGLEYVLMVGDAYPNGGNSGGPDEVPMYWWAPSGEDPSYSDSWYTCLDGPDDHYADLAIGRFVYDNTDELELQIQKTMDHYFNPDSETNWAENSILIAHKEEYPGKYTQCCEEIRTYPYPLQIPIFEAAYGGAGYSNTQVVNYVNANSCGIFNYRGHGSQTELWEWCPQGSFTATHVNQLTNEDRLFVFFDVCCDNMDIVAYNGNCLCESFMKSPVASVAVNGAIIPSYTIPNHDYDKEMYKAVFEEGIYNIGYITNFANVTVLNVHGDLGRSNVRTYLWLGDASLEPWTLQPGNLAATHDDQLFLGLDNFSVTVMGTNGPVENAMVCVANDDFTVYGVAYSDASGYAQVVFDEPVQNPGSAMVTVSAHNHMPYQSEIAVIPQEGPYVIKDSYSLNDATGGNGDGLMDYGESILLTLAVKNVGITTANNVVVTLSTDDDYITFTDNSEVYGNINPDQVIEISNGFAFDVANDIPDGHYALIDVSAEGDADVTWTSSFSVEGHAPYLEMGEIIVSDPQGNNNGKIDPGETVNLIITVENNGSSEAFQVMGELSTNDPYVEIESGPMSYGDIEGENMQQQSFVITADASTPTGHIANFDFGIEANLGITGVGSFFEVIGQIPVLILDLDPNHSSSPAMEDAIDAAGVAYETLTAFPDDLNLYSSVFVCLGIYSTNHVLTTAEGQSLADYLNSGGSLYMEGGDTWYFDASTAVHSMFNINASADGSGDMGTVQGQTGTFTEGMSFVYSGENNWMDHIDPVAPAIAILRNVSPAYGTGVAYDAGDYKTIGTSHEFGGLNDGASPSTKNELMMEYLIFLGIMQSDMVVSFQANETDVCEGSEVEFTDNSIGNITSWEWEFEGGDPATSNQQNPMVTYNTAGSFNVTLTISDGSSSVSQTYYDYIEVSAMPEIPATPTGESSVCTNFTEQSAYLTTGAANASTYMWAIEPGEAGTISGMGTTGTVEWTSDWEGTAMIKVKGMNAVCGEGDFSEAFEVTCSICTGIDVLNDPQSIQIYPNPNSGTFTIEINENLRIDQIVVTNMLNKTILHLDAGSLTDNMVDVNLGDLSKGIYFVKIKTSDSERIEKMIIQ